MLEEGSRRIENLIEDMKEEAAKKGPDPRDSHIRKSKKDQLISGYHSKSERCKRALEMMHKVGTSLNVIVEVIWALSMLSPIN